MTINPIGRDKNGQDRMVVITKRMTLDNSSMVEHHPAKVGVSGSSPDYKTLKQYLKVEGLSLKFSRFNSFKGESPKSARLNSMAMAGENALKKVMFFYLSSQTFQASCPGGL